MRLNKFIASATGKSRREADELISGGRVKVNGKVAVLGTQIDDPSGANGSSPRVTLSNSKKGGKEIVLSLPTEPTLIMLHKPVGYLSSRRAQAKDSKTLYELLPPELKKLKTVGRLDRDSSGLILLTDDGDFAFSMTHPKFKKTKIYEVRLDKPLKPLHQQMINDFGIDLPDGKSRLILEKLTSGAAPTSRAGSALTSAASTTETRDDGLEGVVRESSGAKARDASVIWRITMSEGRNRQIRRTFAALGYTVTKLHRTDFGNYHLGNLPVGKWIIVKKV